MNSRIAQRIDGLALLCAVAIALGGAAGCGGKSLQDDGGAGAGGASLGGRDAGGSGAGGIGGIAGGAGATGGASGQSGAGGRGGAGGSVGGGGSGGGTTGAAGGTGVAGTMGAAGVTGGAGTTGASGTTGSGGVGGCASNTLMPTAPAVPENRVAQAFTTNAAAGGTIVEGTYWLTSLSLYTGPAGATGPTGTTSSETLRFLPENKVETVVQSAGSTTQMRLTFSTAVSGSSLSLTGTCPVGASLETSYTATATTVTLWVPSNGTTPPEVRVYTLADPFCTSTFPSTAPVVSLNRVAETFPATAAGGTVVSGVYYLTALTQYTGPGGATGPSGTRSETLRLTPNTDEFVLAAAIAASKDAYGDWLFARVKVVASSLELTQVCPTAGAVSSLPYTATATTLVIYNPSNSTVESYTMR